MDPKLLELINFGYLVAFVIAVVLVLVRISARAVGYMRAGMKVPDLLPRDLALFAGLALPFVGFLFFRAFGITPREEDWYLAWLLTSNTAALSGVCYWLYYEYFKIEK